MDNVITKSVTLSLAALTDMSRIHGTQIIRSIVKEAAIGLEQELLVELEMRGILSNDENN